jgi:hypothetical protein
LFLTDSKTKYEDPEGLVNAKVFNPDRSSPKDPEFFSWDGVYVAILFLFF